MAEQSDPLAEIERLRGLLGEVGQWLTCTDQILAGSTPGCGKCLPCRIQAEVDRG